uniref:6-cysteine protein n=1 Tax=Parastrongyloides trichosuri TaxID=131310 RepID=A0A0N4ZME8_PARTI
MKYYYIIIIFLYYQIRIFKTEFIEVKNFPEIEWKFEQITDDKTDYGEIDIKKITNNSYVAEYKRHFIKRISCRALFTYKTHPDYHKLSRGGMFKPPNVKICNEYPTLHTSSKKCKSGDSEHANYGTIETGNSDYWKFTCTLNIYGDSSDKSKRTQQHVVELDIQPPEIEEIIYNKPSDKAFFVKCDKNSLIKPGILKTMEIYDKKTNSKSIVYENSKLQGIKDYLVSDANIWIEFYFFFPMKEVAENIEVICLYKYKKKEEDGWNKVINIVKIENKGELIVEDDKWESFRPSIIDEARFECDLIGSFYSRRSNTWLKQLYIDKGVKVENLMWVPVVKGDDDFEFSVTRHTTVISLKNDSVIDMPKDKQSVWRLAYFTTILDDVQCLITFATPLPEGSSDNIKIVKSINDSLPIELSCGETTDLPLKWYHENKYLSEEKINGKNSLYKVLINKLIINSCNEITMGLYMVFSQRNPSIYCSYAYDCVGKYIRIEDLKKIYEESDDKELEPKDLYDIDYEQYTIDKNDDPYLIYRTSKSVRNVVLNSVINVILFLVNIL